MITKRNLGVAAGAMALLVATPLPALAHNSDHPHVKTVNTEVLAPFNLAVNKGHVYVADGGTSLVSRLSKHGKLKTIAEGPQPGDVAGIDLSSNGRYLAYTSTNYGPGGTALNILGPRGSKKTVDLSGYEARKNPDQNVRYGVRNPSQCVKDALESDPEGPPASYKGLVDSHPYSVASAGKRGWYVADAGGNDILKVNKKGHVRTVAVLPNQPLKITAAIAKSQGLPDCVIGVTYKFESVPTDVEVGRDGWLYVTTLAGGPEDPSLGARSSVYKVNPHSGKAYKIASGLSGATNLALKDGKIYVAELFAGRISVIKHGKPRTYVSLESALSVESSRDGLWAGTMADQEESGPVAGTGSIVHITKHK